MDSEVAWLWMGGTSIVGSAYFLYGKRQAQLVPALCGLLLMGYTWAVPFGVWSILIGAALLIAPFVIRP